MPTLANALKVAKLVRKKLRVNEHKPRDVIVVGSLRRIAPNTPAHKLRTMRTSDVDLLVVVPDAAIGNAVVRLKTKDTARRQVHARVKSGGARHIVLDVTITEFRHKATPSKTSVIVDLFLVTRTELPYALFHWTGPRAYNIRTRRHAMRNGWKLNQYGLWERETGRRVPGTSQIHTERQLARKIGVSYREPWER